MTVFPAKEEKRLAYLKFEPYFLIGLHKARRVQEWQE